MSDKITYQHGTEFLSLAELSLKSGKTVEEVLGCLAKSWTIQRIISQKNDRQLRRQQVTVGMQLMIDDKIENYSGTFTVTEKLLAKSKSKIMLELSRRLVKKYFYQY